MLTNKQIKVIKQADRNASSAPAVNKGQSVGEHLGEAKPDGVMVVTEWVNELRRKRAQESALGFQSLFREPSPS